MNLFKLFIDLFNLANDFNIHCEISPQGLSSDLVNFSQGSFS